MMNSQIQMIYIEGGNYICTRISVQNLCAFIISVHSFGTLLYEMSPHEKALEMSCHRLIFMSCLQSFMWNKFTIHTNKEYKVFHIVL